MTCIRLGEHERTSENEDGRESKRTVVESNTSCVNMKEVNVQIDKSALAFLCQNAQ